MNNEMVERIKEKLCLKKNNLYCGHDTNTVCESCCKKIYDNVSGINGNVSGINGNVTEIIKILKEAKKWQKNKQKR